jgi:hypothetical protein
MTVANAPDQGSSADPPAPTISTQGPAMPRRTTLAAILLLSVLCPGRLVLGADPAEEHFERKVRPILADCLKCHGPDKQSSDLRLDSREALLKGGSAEGASIIPGKPDQSPLIKAVRHQGEIHMPPKGKLPEAAVNDLADWIKSGAAWPKAAGAQAGAGANHWSFQPVRKPPIPPGQGSVSAIDAFVNARITQAGLKPEPRTDRRTLLRRATFDLIGLPPTPEEVDAFLSDSRTDREAFAEVVERLLASPHYGERWGRLWLDVARYADTKGYVFNEDKRYPYSYTYRDWVVEALNEDMPYDQFVLRQVAADRLPAVPDNRNLAALGFLTVGRRFLQDQNEIIDDRIDVVSRGLLGLSVTCARCHDHKFDPIPTDDYYSLYGVFASSEEPGELPLLHNSGGAKDAADYAKKQAERKSALDAFLTDRKTSLEKELRTKLSAYLAAAEALDFNPRSPKFDEVVKASGLRPELIRRIAMRWRDRLNANDPLLEPWKAFAALAPAEFRSKSIDAVLAIRKTAGAKPSPLVQALTATPPTSRGEVIKRYGEFLARALANPTDKSLDNVRQWLESPTGLLTVAPNEFRRILGKVDRDKLQALEKRVIALDASHPGAPARAMVMVDKAKPVEPHVFLRGNPGRPGNQVPRRFLRVISATERPAFKDGSGRLELARAIASKDNPLTARVIVNRVWFNHFGQGIVRTPSDFGARGEPPTHPELLDWLASTFVEGGWSLKSLHRMIMSTDAYQRRSDASPEVLRKDPQNFWLSHQNRRRLDFETMRDGLLAAAGRLDPAVGGKSVPIETEPFTTRRTLYGYIERQNLDPIYRTFDFPNPDATSPRRTNTIVPQQALFLLNSPFVAEQARHLATRPEVAAGSAEERVRKLYHVLFGRDPEPHELAIGVRFASHNAAAEDSPASPWHYGAGTVLDKPGHVHVADFHAFPHWTGKAWQVVEKLPAPGSNFANINAAGGHPGPSPKWMTIVRWVAPSSMAVSLTGTLEHPSKGGDGVRARLVSSRSGLLGTWEAHEKKVETTVARIEVRRGETLDLVIDCKGDESFDSYSWAPAFKVLGTLPEGLRTASWNARNDFHGPEPKALSPWESYAQALMLTNEYYYVD